MSELREKPESAGARQRIALLDLWRFLAMCAMVVYHLIWDLEYFGALAPGVSARWWALALRYACGGSFILVSGACAACSRDPKRRGFIGLCAGLLVRVVTAYFGAPVRFGVLELLGWCQIGYGLLKPRLEERDLPAALWLGGFLLTAPAAMAVVQKVGWLYPFGIRRYDFYSADWWPLLPWAFLFLAGTKLGPVLERKPQPRLPRPAAVLARHSLAVYLLHQPLLLGLCRLILGRK